MQHILEAKELCVKGNVLEAINKFEIGLNGTKVTDYILTKSIPNSIPKEEYINAWYSLGTLYKFVFEESIERYNVYNTFVKAALQKSSECFINVLRISVHNEQVFVQLASLYTRACLLVKEDYDQCLHFLDQLLIITPENDVLHYNLGHVYQRKHDIAKSLIHYKLSIRLSKDPQLIVNSLNGIGCLYRSLKSWNESRYYLEEAVGIIPNDPDIHNQLGIVYTELRRSDLAIDSYKIAMENYKNTFISSDHNTLLTEIYLNMGHMHSYNGDNVESMNCYNKAIEINPKFRLPFQNKLMNLNYLFDDLQDKMYITRQHRYINAIVEKGEWYSKVPPQTNEKGRVRRIGIVSGDFTSHPVSYFISAFLRHHSRTLFHIICYSECVIDVTDFDIEFKRINGKSARQVADIIVGDRIDILIDLAGHTAYNRVDVFALKPAKYQVNYCGYPFSSGLSEMDFRITDRHCDDETVSQPFYNEKLVFVKDCFLCYQPNSIPDVTKVPQPLNKTGQLTIGCFNRLNKINRKMIQLVRDILLFVPNCRFVFKTKAFENDAVKERFLCNFSKDARERIEIRSCTVLHEEHLLEYNLVDVSLDTFPYSGTTTSCESLLMGVPVFTMPDTVDYFHAQNVTKSLLANTFEDYSKYLFDSNQDIVKKLNDMAKKTLPDNFKAVIQKTFLNGNVCNVTKYVENFQEALLSFCD